MPGETLNGKKFEMGFGGKGANQCVMAAKLGAKAAMVGKVGEDVFGKDTISNFQSLGVDTKHLTTTKERATGCAPIIVNDDGQNSIIVILGANELLSEADVAAASPMLQSAKVVVCQHEVPIETSIAALKIAADAKVTSIFNPAPAQPPLPAEAYTLPTIFCVNETEAQLFSGVEVVDEATAETAGLKLMAMGCKTVLLTLGEKGVMYLTPNAPPLTVPTVKVKAIDTSGAGDAYIGALSFYLAKGLDFEEALRRSNVIAAESVTGHGTQTSYKLKAELPVELFHKL